MSQVDLVSIKRQANESIDEYLNRFKQMKARCLTQVPEHELVQMAAGGLEYSTRKKMINQQLRDMVNSLRQRDRSSSYGKRKKRTKDSRNIPGRTRLHMWAWLIKKTPLKKRRNI